MLTLTTRRLLAEDIPVGTGWLLGACMEARGRQDLWIRQKPEVLEVLREQAIVQSAESSNRIEGVTVPEGRLRPLVLGRATPRDRSEEEIAGYRRALSWIFTRKGRIEVTPNLVRRLHTLAQGGQSGDAGRWKSRDNEIVELLPNGERRIRFVPTPARQTPSTMQALCENYREVCDLEQVPLLLLAAAFVFDFLCIHPFRDGNGRVSRLLSTLLLQSQGYEVARYVSLERLVEERKEEYYAVLERCSERWHDGRNVIVPWWNFWLSVLRAAYMEFERQVNSVSARSSKSDLIRHAVLEQVGQFTLADMSAQLPSVSPQLIKRVLAELKTSGHVHLEGRGRGAQWRVVHRP